MSGNWRTFDNYGYIVFTVPEDILSIFTDTYDKVKSKVLTLPPHNYNLAGQIKEEYSLKHLVEVPCVKDYLDDIASTYVNFFNVPKCPQALDPKDGDWDIKLKYMWMNVQKKHEYNPIHTHDGVLSFALWLKIPYDIETELGLEHSNTSNMRTNGSFYFHPVNALGEIANTAPKAEEYKEGNLVVFPSKLSHSVYPFYTSDEDRVSIAGNFYYTPKGTK